MALTQNSGPLDNGQPATTPVGKVATGSDNQDAPSQIAFDNVTQEDFGALLAKINERFPTSAAVGVPREELIQVGLQIASDDLILERLGSLSKDELEVLKREALATDVDGTSWSADLSVPS